MAVLLVEDAIYGYAVNHVHSLQKAANDQEIAQVHMHVYSLKLAPCYTDQDHSGEQHRYRAEANKVTTDWQASPYSGTSGTVNAAD